MLAAVRAAEEPFKEEFYSVHHDLEALLAARRASHRVIGKDEMIR